MRSKSNNNKSTKTLHQMGLLSGKAMEREEQDLDRYFKEKVKKDTMDILRTLDFIRENNPEPIIIFQPDY